ncbi:UNVERIFIED_CONTAM: hypothetical protein RMT77_001071 [Armadillidium vulgare]
MGDKVNIESEFAFMCGKCFNVFSTVEETGAHVCVDRGQQKAQIFETAESYITAEVVKLEPPYSSEENGNALIVSEKGKIDYETIEGIEDITRELDIRNIGEGEENEYEIIEDEGQRRKRRVNNSEYIMNKLVRDPYFKLDHNSYTFKDTLGDWDERSTKLLIILVGKYPKVHFLLQFYFERRLTHWESIHSCMLNAGYNFTVLQLRMRWREVFAKYRWTLNHNDLYEDKKTFEYMKEMDDLFAVWTKEATETLINYVEYNYKDNPSSKHKRLGYLGWERIASFMTRDGFKYSTLQVEARWRMLVTTYKSMIDHNIMPTVEPIEAAFHERLKHLINYEPRRRKDYERYKGKKVKLEKFPENGMKHLIQSYKENSIKFLDSSIKNSEVWEDIKKSLDSIGYCYPVTKIKEIFFATLKLYERVLQHNSIPGAIKREGPHFKELSEIFNLYGFWPHVRRKRKTSFEKHHRKCAQRLRESMQTWTVEESAQLLKIYPDVLESFMAQTTTSQQSDLWVQVAQAFQALGYPKRDTPEIATHIGLLRQGYNQTNNFPFADEMQRVMEVEEALCYSPDVSKYTGDVEILYWSHDAIYLMLNLYLKIQPLLPYSSLSKEVYARISKEMLKYGYNYSCDQVKEEFRNLLFQFTMRRYKPEKASMENWAKNKDILLYKEEMKQVMLLREKLSVGFTNGIKPIPNDVLEVIYRVAREKVEELFQGATNLSWEEQKERMKLVVFIIRRQIKKIIKRKPPVARKICVQLLTSLFNITETTERVSEDLASLYCSLQNYDYEGILTEIMKETHNGSFKLSRRVLNMERQSETILSQEQDTLEPVCVLSVNEIKSEVIEDEPVEDDESSNELYQIFRVSVADVLEEKPNLLELSSSLEKHSSDVTVDHSIEEFAKSSKKFNKLILINKELGTKTTVLPQENNEVTCISIDDLFVKQEPSEEIDLSSVSFDSNYEFSNNNKSSTNIFDQKRESPEFDVVHSLDLNDDDSQATEDDEEEEDESPNKGFTSMEGVTPLKPEEVENYDSESSLMSMLAHQFHKSNSVDREDDQTLKVLNKREVFNELLIQINELE